jgi:FkbM family methyltransferase
LGLASLYFLHRYPNCQLTTLEPNPALGSLLRKTLEPYADRATLLEAALSTRAGSVEFHITADNLTNVTGGIDNREAPEREVRRLSVPCRDAREVLAEPVDLLKLDVEGHEYELLQLELFRPDHVKNMVVEFHDLDQRGEQFRALLARLVDARGYRVADADDVELGSRELARESAPDAAPLAAAARVQFGCAACALHRA